MDGTRLEVSLEAADAAPGLLGTSALRLQPRFFLSPPVQLDLGRQRPDHLVDGEPARLGRAAVEHLRVSADRHESMWPARPYVAVVWIVEVDLNDDL